MFKHRFCKWGENYVKAGIGLWCVPPVQLFTRDCLFFFFSRLHLIARSEWTQQKFIYSLFCDFQAAEQGSWPQEHGYRGLLKHMWSLFMLICPVSGLATKSKVQGASVWEEKWVVFKNPAESPPKMQLTGAKMESGHEMLARVWKPVQLRSRMFTLFCFW